MTHEELDEYVWSKLLSKQLAHYRKASDILIASFLILKEEEEEHMLNFCLHNNQHKTKSAERHRHNITTQHSLLIIFAFDSRSFVIIPIVITQHWQIRCRFDVIIE
jgi:hypothetical protein